MYRYLVFSATYYYPGGGMEDCYLKSSSVDEVLEKLKSLTSETVPNEIYQIYDIENDLSLKYESVLNDCKLEESENENGITIYTPESIERFLNQVRKDLG